MRTTIERWQDRFVDRVFTDDEIAYCRSRRDPAPHFAARFAAKEAFLKALGAPPGLRWTEIEVRSTPGGAPVLVLSGEAAAAARRRGVASQHLSLTHAGDVAAAVVVLEAGPS